MILIRVTVQCDRVGCAAEIHVPCSLKVNSVPGPVEADVTGSGEWQESGWQEKWDRYDDTYTHYCPEHRVEERW